MSDSSSSKAFPKGLILPYKIYIVNMQIVIQFMNIHMDRVRNSSCFVRIRTKRFGVFFISFIENYKHFDLLRFVQLWVSRVKVPLKFALEQTNKTHTHVKHKSWCSIKYNTKTSLAIIPNANLNITM